MTKMKIINNEYYVNRYNHSTAAYLDEVYDKYSDEKAEAFEAIRQEMLENNGWGLRITSHTIQFFTCAYLMTNKQTGEILLVQHTPTHRYVVQY